MSIRRFSPGDSRAVLDLIAADQLPGQPTCTEQDLVRALTGQCDIDQHWWQSFREVQTMVLEESGEILGAASSAVHAEEGDAYVLWMHAAERAGVINSLLEWMLDDLRAAPSIRAFWIATPLTLGVEGLPIQHRAVTHEALRAHGFHGEDLWLYMQGPVAPAATRLARIEAKDTGQRLILEDEAGVIGEAEVSLGADGTGALWWLEVKEGHRRQGYGRILLAEALALVGELGARHVILYVDHDDPSGRDRRPAVALYQSVGFVTVDHLWSYSRTSRGTA